MSSNIDVSGAVVGGRGMLWAALLAPVAVFLAVIGPIIGQHEGLPFAGPPAQFILAVLGGLAAVGAVFHADRATDEVDTMADQNLRVLLLLMAFLALIISAAWVWLGSMALLNWVVEGVWTRGA